MHLWWQCCTPKPTHMPTHILIVTGKMLEVHQNLSYNYLWVMKLGTVSIFFFLAKTDFCILLYINICYFVIDIKAKKKKIKEKESEREKKMEVT